MGVKIITIDSYVSFLGSLTLLYTIFTRDNDELSLSSSQIY